MIHGILMSNKTLKDLNVDAHIAVLHTKVDALLEKQKELTQRVRANEKVVAAVTLLGTVAIAVIGAGYFAPKVDAEVRGDLFDGSVFDVAHMGHSFPTDRWIEKLREHESKKNRPSIDDMLNSSLAEYENGSNDPTEQEELLQLPSNGD